MSPDHARKVNTSLEKLMKTQAIVVLSGGITKKGSLPFFIKSRLDEAIRQYQGRGIHRIIVTGKWSYYLDKKPRTTEAQAMRKYLVKHGIPEKHITLEEHATDLISSLVLVRDTILAPKRIKSIVLVGSDFQDERLRYVGRMILEPTVSVHYILNPSRLSPNLLWNFYMYERKTLQKTIGLFSRNPKIDKQIKKGDYHRDRFYKEKTPGLLRSLVYSQSVGKPGKPTHFSLASVYKIRKEVFTKYGLSSPSIKTLKTDFWSGRFLNFVCHDEHRSYYCLKFALLPKEKEKYRHEVKLINYLHDKGFSFVPEIVASNLTKGPYWYLYKVLSGKASGSFSQTYAFEKRFYKPFVMPQIIRHLKTLRGSKPRHIPLTTWNKSYFIGKFSSNLTKAVEAKKTLPSTLLTKSLAFVTREAGVLNVVPTYLSHNDLHTGNILVSSGKKKVYFIDFEHTGYNTIAFDMCFVYIFSWNKRGYQSSFREAFTASLTPSEKEQFDRVFPVTYMYFLIWFLSFVSKWRVRAGEENYKKAVAYIESEIQKVLLSHRR